MFFVDRVPQDVEPTFTLRRHRGAVNALAFTTLIPASAEPELESRLQFGMLFSAGLDKNILLWGVPGNDVLPYSHYSTLLFNALDSIPVL